MISALTKSQYLACHISLMVSFLPAVILSGFLFDLHAEPLAIRVVSRLLPTTYYLDALKSLLLSGGSPLVIAQDTAALAAFTLLFLALAFYMTRKKVDA